MDTLDIFRLKSGIKAHVRFTSSTMIGFNGGPKGSDLTIQNWCNLSQNCHSKLGCMFNIPNDALISPGFDPQTYLAGAKNFRVKAIEVFEVKR